jgi:hypothetical protein
LAQRSLDLGKSRTELAGFERLCAGLLLLLGFFRRWLRDNSKWVFNRQPTALAAEFHGKIERLPSPGNPMKTQALPPLRKHSDAVLLFLAGLALFLELALLFHQLRFIQLPFLGTSGKNGVNGVGEVLRKSRSVQSRTPGSLTWYPLAEGDSIELNETVMTGASSEVAIVLKEGGELVLEPYTLLKFNREFQLGGRRLALEVGQGAVKVRSREKKVLVAVGDQGIELSPGTEAVLTTSENKLKSELAVTSGSAALVSKTDSAPLAVQAGQTVSLSSRGQSTPVIVNRWVPQLTSPKVGERFFAANEKTPVTFAWKEAAADTLEIASAEDMASAKRFELKSNSIAVDLPSGNYFWRLRKADAFSKVSPFSVVPLPKYQIDRNVSRERVKEGMEITLRWKPIAKVSQYRLVLSRSNRFTPIEREERVLTNEVELKALPPGKYYWKVQATHSEWGELPESAPFELVVKKRMQPPEVKGAKVIPEKRRPPEPQRKPTRKSEVPSVSIWSVLAGILIPEAMAETPKVEETKVFVEFSWKAVKGAKAYRLEVSPRPDFKRVVSSSEGTRSTAILELPWREKYYWRVAAIDEDGDLGKYSSTQSVTKIVPRSEALAATVREIPKPNAPPPQARKPSSIATEFSRPQYLQLWGGYGASIVSQSIGNSDYLIRSSGVPLNRMVAGVKYDFESISAESVFSLQPLRYTSTGTQNAFSYWQWNADVYLSRLFWARKIPLGLGVRVRSEQSVPAVSTSTVTLNSTLYTAVLFGADWKFPTRFPWVSSLWLEAAPIGTKAGLGLVFRNRLDLPWQWGDLRPALELWIYPHYRYHRTSYLSEWNVEAGFNLILGWSAQHSGPTVETAPTKRN